MYEELQADLKVASRTRARGRLGPRLPDRTVIVSVLGEAKSLEAEIQGAGLVSVRVAR